MQKIEVIANIQFVSNTHNNVYGTDFLADDQLNGAERWVLGFRLGGEISLSAAAAKSFVSALRPQAHPPRILRPIETYNRPKWRKGVREQMWENAIGPDGFVRNPLTGRIMNYDEPWHIEHGPAQECGLTHEQYIDEYKHPDIYQYHRPEIPALNVSHAMQAADDVYFGP